MGKNRMQKLSTKDWRWTDKNTPKHKHEYSIEVTLELEQGCKGHRYTSYYRAIKCKYCNSLGVLTEEQVLKQPIEGLLLVRLTKPNGILGLRVQSLSLTICKAFFMSYWER